MGRHFLHEDPMHASSWCMPEMRELLNDGRIHLVQGPMCHWRMAATNDRDDQGFVRGRMRWVTSSLRLATLLGRERAGENRRVPLVGQNGTIAGAMYSPRLVKEVLRALGKQLVDDVLLDSVSLCSAGPTADFLELDTQEWQEDDYDQQGNLLDPTKVKEGKRDEIDWVLKHKFFDNVPESECAERQGRHYSLKWVLKNKGEKVRARLVVREIKKAKSEDEKLEPSDVFSAMPPVESLKALVSHVMTERVDKRGRHLILAVFDVSRAHFYGVCEREVYVEPPSELHRPGLVAKLNKTIYGAQDASNAWQKLWREHLRSNGFELGASNPALHRSELVRGFCHGDDFVIAAAYDQIECFGKLLQEKFDTRRIGMIGAAEHFWTELEVLHRSVRVINDELMEIEVHQKHVPQLLEDLGLIQSDIVKTPRVKLMQMRRKHMRTIQFLKVRCAYLAQDRVDISEAIKCLARAMSKPRAGHMTQLKRVARYLKGVPRKAQQCPSQEPSRARP